MLRNTVFLLLALAAALLASCGGDGVGPSPTATATTAGQLAPLARAAPKPGELVFSGESSPQTHSDFELDGRYLVRFEQFAPEDPSLDFAGQTPFTATLRRASAREGGRKLFGSASASGSMSLTARGTYVLDVSFGDFPYAVRFTPRR